MKKKEGRMILQTRSTSILLAVMIVIVAVAVNGNYVSGDSCVATLNYPIMPVVNSYSNVPVVVPVSATCTTYYGQLYATGSAFDVASNVDLGSVSTVLQSVNGGTVFNGQLGFSLPASTQSHTIQISVVISNGQYGSPITATSEAFQVGSGGQQVYTTTVTQFYGYPNLNQYPYPQPYPNQYYVYPSAPNQYPFHRTHTHPWEGRSQGVDTGVLFDYVAIAAILGAVIIATAGLVVYGRRQPTWIPIQPPPPHS